MKEVYSFNEIEGCKTGTITNFGVDTGNQSEVEDRKNNVQSKIWPLSYILLVQQEDQRVDAITSNIVSNVLDSASRTF
jgi:long-chain acyl-CoA synthetase